MQSSSGFLNAFIRTYSLLTTFHAQQDIYALKPTYYRSKTVAPWTIASQDNCRRDNCPSDNCPPDSCSPDNCPPGNCPLDD